MNGQQLERYQNIQGESDLCGFRVRVGGIADIVPVLSTPPTQSAGTSAADFLKTSQGSTDPRQVSIGLSVSCTSASKALAPAMVPNLNSLTG